jgi:hypothetical protein
MTEAGGGPETEPRAELEARLAAAHDLLERGRRAVAGGELANLDKLAPLLQGLADQFGRLPQIDQRLRGRLLALLDDVGSLTETLRREQARLAVQLRTAGAHRRARTAYRRASRL